MALFDFLFGNSGSAGTPQAVDPSSDPQKAFLLRLANATGAAGAAPSIPPQPTQPSPAPATPASAPQDPSIGNPPSEWLQNFIRAQVEAAKAKNPWNNIFHHSSEKAAEALAQVAAPTAYNEVQNSQTNTVNAQAKLAQTMQLLKSLGINLPAGIGGADNVPSSPDAAPSATAAPPVSPLQDVQSHRAKLQHLGNLMIGYPAYAEEGRQLLKLAQAGLPTGTLPLSTGGVADAVAGTPITQGVQDYTARGEFKNAAARAQGKASVPDASGNDGAGDIDAYASTAPDPLSRAITGQTGMSYPTFQVLTGDLSKLPKGKERDKALQSAREFANKNNVDPATLAAQYKAYTKTLQSNIERNNQTKIMEDELTGTIANLQPVSDAAGNGNLRIGNVANLFAGKEFNDPMVSQYAFHLNQLRTELAAYSAATQGRTGNNITLQDMNEAQHVIMQGLNSRSAGGLQKAVDAATHKMDTVLQRNIKLTNKAIWGLFGVGDQYEKVNGLCTHIG